MSTTVRIVKTADVLHGKPRIEGTRVGVFQIGESVRRGGWAVDEAATQFDLETAQVRAALDYYDDHPELMDTLRTQKRARRASIAAESRLE